MYCRREPSLPSRRESPAALVLEGGGRIAYMFRGRRRITSILHRKAVRMTMLVRRFDSRFSQGFSARASAQAHISGSRNNKLARTSRGYAEASGCQWAQEPSQLLFRAVSCPAGPSQIHHAIPDAAEQLSLELSAVPRRLDGLRSSLWQQFGPAPKQFLFRRLSSPPCHLRNNLRSRRRHPCSRNTLCAGKFRPFLIPIGETRSQRAGCSEATVV
jgi:hypothetical protein